MKRFPLTPTEYHKLAFAPSLLPDVAKAGYISASLLTKMRDPLSFLLGNGEVKQTAAMKWGSLIDCLWTTPELFNQEYIILPENAPQKPTDAMLNAAKPSPASLERQAWWNDFNRRSENKTTVAHDEHRDALSAVSMLNQNTLAREIWQASEKQVALVGNNPILPGTKAKCLFDLLPMGGPFVDAIVDLKETNDVSERGLVNTMHNFDYVMKLAFYGILAEAAGFGPRSRGILIWQNSSYPYDVHTREIDPKDMAIGRQVAINRCNTLTKLDARRLEQHFDVELKTLSMPDWSRNSHLKP
jgi:hypothetical protein